LKITEKITEHLLGLVTLITFKDPSNRCRVKSNLYDTIDSGTIKALSYVNEMFKVFNYKGKREREKYAAIRNRRAFALTTVLHQEH